MRETGQEEGYCSVQSQVEQIYYPLASLFKALDNPLVVFLEAQDSATKLL